MLDLVRLVALIVALTRSIHVRSVLGVVCAGLVVFGSAAVIVDVLGAASQAAVGGEHGLGFVFLGTSLVEVPANAGSRATAWFTAHPAGRHLAFAALATAPFTAAWYRSALLRPESKEARAWDAMGTPFLLLAVIETALLGLALFVAWGVGR